MSLVWIKPVCQCFLLFLRTVEANIKTWTDIRLSREKRKIIKDLNEQRIDDILKDPNSIVKLKQGIDLNFRCNSFSNIKKAVSSPSKVVLLSTTQLTASKTGQVA